MKLDWYLAIGSALVLCFIATRFIDSPFANGLGAGLGLVGIIAVGASVAISKAGRRRDTSARDETPR